MTNVEDMLDGTQNQIRAYVNSRRSISELREILEYESRNENRGWVIRNAKERMREVR